MALNRILRELRLQREERMLDECLLRDSIVRDEEAWEHEEEEQEVVADYLERHEYGPFRIKD